MKLKHMSSGNCSNSDVLKEHLRTSASCGLLSHYNTKELVMSFHLWVAFGDGHESCRKQGSAQMSKHTLGCPLLRRCGLTRRGNSFSVLPQTTQDGMHMPASQKMLRLDKTPMGLAEQFDRFASQRGHANPANVWTGSIFLFGLRRSEFESRLLMLLFPMVFLNCHKA